MKLFWSQSQLSMWKWIPTSVVFSSEKMTSLSVFGWFCHFMTNMSSFPLFNLYHDIEKSCRIWLWNIAFLEVEVGVLKETQKFTSAKKVSIIMENFLNLNFCERILSQNLCQVLEIQGSGKIKIGNISLVFNRSLVRYGAGSRGPWV